MIAWVVIDRRHARQSRRSHSICLSRSASLYLLNFLTSFTSPCLPSSVPSSKFRIPQLLCLPLLRKLPGCVPTIPILERFCTERRRRPFVTRRYTQVLFFQSLAHSFARDRNSTRLFSNVSALFAKNHPGGGGVTSLPLASIGFLPLHPIKSPRCPYPACKWTGQSRTHYE